MSMNERILGVMYQYSRAIYRTIKDMIDPYGDRDSQIESSRAVLMVCETTMERLAWCIVRPT